MYLGSFGTENSPDQNPVDRLTSAESRWSRGLYSDSSKWVVEAGIRNRRPRGRLSKVKIKVTGGNNGYIRAVLIRILQ